MREHAMPPSRQNNHYGTGVAAGLVLTIHIEAPGESYLSISFLYLAQSVAHENLKLILLKSVVRLGSGNKLSCYRTLYCICSSVGWDMTLSSTPIFRKFLSLAIEYTNRAEGVFKKKLPVFR